MHAIVPTRVVVGGLGRGRPKRSGREGTSFFLGTTICEGWMAIQGLWLAEAA